MTPDQFKEYEYRRNERLGMMCEDREPTFEQITMANAEAQAVIDAIETQEQLDRIARLARERRRDYSIRKHQQEVSQPYKDL